MMSGLLRRGGFDPQRLAFTLRTALGAGLALLVAGALGLDHPQWAAMTVWIAAQPLRGHLLEKGLFRLLGTAVGVVVGATLVVLSGGAPAFVVPGLALWVGLCAGIGQLLRGFLSYGALLAGYSAAMVALLDVGRPEAILPLCADRLATIALGVGVAFVVSAWFAAPGDRSAAQSRMRDLIRLRLRELARWARDGVVPEEAQRHAQLVDLARLEQGLELQVAGMPGTRRRVRAHRDALTALVGLLLWWPRATAVTAVTVATSVATGVREDRSLSRRFDEVADAMERHEPVSLRLERLAARAEDGDPELAALLARLARAADDPHAWRDPSSGQARGLAPHRDWVAAREAGLRSTFALLLTGGLWLISGSPLAPFLMLGVAVMVSLFSTVENPVRMMRSVFAGQVLGALAALVIQAWFWPLVDGVSGRLLLCLPLLALGAFLLAHSRSAGLGMDFNLVSLLLLSPMHPPVFTWQSALVQAVAIAVAPLVALLMFRWVLPPDGRRRFTQLLTRMQSEIADMAAQPRAWRRREIWRALLQHRLLRLVRWADQAGLPPGQVGREGLAVLATGQAVLAVQRALAQDHLAPEARRRAQALLRRLARRARDPHARRRQILALRRGARHRLLACGLDPAQLLVAAQALQGAAHQEPIRKLC